MTGGALTLEELRGCRAEILCVARKHRARRVAVFGSVARGEARVDTGWTMTFASKLLRGCGASSVLPFALAVTS